MCAYGAKKVTKREIGGRAHAGALTTYIARKRKLQRTNHCDARMKHAWNSKEKNISETAIISAWRSQGLGFWKALPQIKNGSTQYLESRARINLLIFEHHIFVEL